jgi:hypothetical protein
MGKRASGPIYDIRLHATERSPRAVSRFCAPTAAQLNGVVGATDAAIFGKADDAPGLRLLGTMLIVSAVCARREDRAARQVVTTAAGKLRVARFRD